MSNSHSVSWAQVLLDGSASAPVDSRRLEFNWKAAKKGRRKSKASTAKDECAGGHCRMGADHCTKKECTARLDRELSMLKAENDASAAAFTELLRELGKLRNEILENCNVENLSSSEIEQSRVAVLKARRANTTPVSCECVCCQLAFQQNEHEIAEERLSAAQHRLKVLRQYRLANDKGAIQRTTAHFNQSAKYFTPVGTPKAMGASALRPTLQLQNSYDVAALVTNSMIGRPLKTPKDEKPKKLAGGQSKSNFEDGDNGEDDSSGWQVVKKRK